MLDFKVAQLLGRYAVQLLAAQLVAPGLIRFCHPLTPNNCAWWQTTKDPATGVQCAVWRRDNILGVSVRYWRDGEIIESCIDRELIDADWEFTAEEIAHRHIAAMIPQLVGVLEGDNAVDSGC